MAPETDGSWSGEGAGLHDPGEGALASAEGSLQWSAWAAPGPVSSAYVADDAFCRAIMGPYGAAKTTTSYFDTLVKAVRQPRCIDGVRRHYVLTVRDTFTNLYKTAIKSWLQWFPREWGAWEGSPGRAATHVVTFEDAYGPVEITAYFDALGEREPEAVLDGYEFTEAFLNGCTSLPAEVLTYVIGRVGRAPRRDKLPAGARLWSGVKMDCNAPDVENWFYRMFGEGQLPDGYRFFRQPGGLDPDAENLANLNGGRAYYERMAAANAKNPWWVRRFVHNRWGYSRAGEPVFAQFDDAIHATGLQRLEVVKGRDIYLGLDGGKTLHPAAVIAQLDDRTGQLRILAELAPGRMGASRFADMLDRLLSTRFAGCRIGGAWADPTAGQGADQEGGEISWLQVLEARLGISINYAPTNEVAARLDCVGELLGAMDGRTPGLLISAPDCPALVKGGMSHYRYSKVRVSGEDVAAERPAKLHPWSDLWDAVQYLALGLFGETHAARRGRRRGESRPYGRDQGDGDAPVTAFRSDFDPMNV